jgi:hypothetical protein
VLRSPQAIESSRALLEHEFTRSEGQGRLPDEYRRALSCRLRHLSQFRKSPAAVLPQVTRTAAPFGSAKTSKYSSRATTKLSWASGQVLFVGVYWLRDAQRFLALQFRLLPGMELSVHGEVRQSGTLRALPCLRIANRFLQTSFEGRRSLNQQRLFEGSVTPA